jgi:hypothetical protein
VELTDEKIMETLKAVVAESPDKVYAAPEHMVSLDYSGQPTSMTCFYVHTDENGDRPTPGCLVGQVLNRLGVELDYLADREGTGADALGSGLGISVDARTLLAIAQDRQDHGSTWGKALADAIEGEGVEL